MSAKSIKKQIRHKIISHRKQLTPQQIHSASRKVWQHLKQAYFYKRARRVAFYMGMHGEIDPVILLQQKMSKTFYLPRLNPNQYHRLDFVQVNQQSKMKTNQYGIPEPSACNQNIAPPYLLDLVLCPLVAFDLQGNRLGMGGGYYDRTFSFKSNSQQKPLLVGLAHDFQQCPQVPHTPRDIRLNIIVTPSRIIKIAT